MKEHEPGSEVWGYADSPNPDRWSGACATREEAIAEGRNELRVNACAPIFIVKGRVPSAAEFLPSAESFLEDMGNRAGDEYGEAAEEFPDVSDEGRREFEALLTAWAEKYIDPIRFWLAASEPERIDPPPLELWNDSCHFVIAENAEKARAILIEALGLDDDETQPANEWERWPADKPFTVVDEDEHQRVSLLPADWAKVNGPGYIGSMET